MNYQTKTKKVQAMQVENDGKFFGNDILKGDWIVLEDGYGMIYSDEEFKDLYEPIPFVPLKFPGCDEHPGLLGSKINTRLL